MPEKTSAVLEHQLLRDGEERILRINCNEYDKIPSLEDDPQLMAQTLSILVKEKDATKIVYSQKREYEYDLDQTLLLVQVAKVYQKLMQQRHALSLFSIGQDPQYRSWYSQRQEFLNQILHFMIKEDPIAAHVQLSRAIREERMFKDNLQDTVLKAHTDKYINILSYIREMLGQTKLITTVQAKLAGYNRESRELYKSLFRATMKPAFMFTKLQARFPDGAELLDSYTVGDTEINIFKLPDSVQYMYHMLPPEFMLTEEEYELLDSARNIMAEHKPSKQEFVDPERMREVFMNVGEDLLTELVQHNGIDMSQSKIKKLSKILVRYTVGFGLIEVLMEDEETQDVSVNSPLGRIPIYLVHGKYGDCITNILPTRSESESWATKLRLISGRPLDEANPLLDTEIEFPAARVRVSAVTAPLNPTGLGFSFRRHRNKPWTLPLFIKVGMINPIGAGLLSFLIDGTKTMLIAGTRSSGKSSFLTSLMLEIMPRYRIITIEDTLELPVRSFRDMGYNILSLKVSSALGTHKEEGADASFGIRSTLRLGDSSLIVGEVRSKEAVALYEAMRIGAAANVVAGTIHADSPYGVFDRVVNDIGVPKTSFKATDVIICANPIKSADGIHKKRRVTSITEVRKDWEDDPGAENGFVELLKYNPHTDQLEPTADLMNGDSDVIKSIAGNIKIFAGNWDVTWDNILLRAKIKEHIVNVSEKVQDPDMLEAVFCLKCNDKMHNLMDESIERHKKLDSEWIFNEFDRWIQKEVKKKQMVSL